MKGCLPILGFLRFLKCTGILKLVLGKCLDKFWFLDYGDLIYRNPLWAMYHMFYLRRFFSF